MASSSRTPSGTHARKDSPEDYASLARRNAAAETLQSYDRLSWHAAARNESLVQTRLHFQNIIAGFDDSDTHAWSTVSKVWKTDTTPHVPDAPDWEPVKERCKTAVTGGSGSGKGKDRKSGEGASEKGKGREDDVGEARKGKKRKSGGSGEAG
nr:hypothetical protein B0A51_05001 [Rachicladosporium sp. CCFEE 5018]